MVVYDPVYRRLEDPVDVDLQQQLSSPLVRDFRPLPSAGLIKEEIQSQHQVAAPNGDLDRRSEQRERPASRAPRRTNLWQHLVRSLFVTLRASVARL